MIYDNKAGITKIVFVNTVIYLYQKLSKGLTENVFKRFLMHGKNNGRVEFFINWKFHKIIKKLEKVEINS